MEDSAEIAHLLSTKPFDKELWRTYENNRKFRARVVQSIFFCCYYAMGIYDCKDMSRWIAAIGQTQSLRGARDLIMKLTPDVLMTPCFNTVLRFCLGWNYSPPTLGK